MAERKTATVKIGEREIEFVELSFQESMMVDQYIPNDADGNPSGMALAKVYALAAVRKVNGEYVNGAANQVEWIRVSSMFTAFESFQLAGEYNRVFAGVESLESRVKRTLPLVNKLEEWLVTGGGVPEPAVGEVRSILDQMREALTVNPIKLTDVVAGEAVKNA